MRAFDVAEILSIRGAGLENKRAMLFSAKQQQGFGEPPLMILAANYDFWRRRQATLPKARNPDPSRIRLIGSRALAVWMQAGVLSPLPQLLALAPSWTSNAENNATAKTTPKVACFIASTIALHSKTAQ